MGSIGPATGHHRAVRDSDIGTLKSLLTGTHAKIITPSDNEVYKTAIARWSMAASKPAGVVVQPSTPQEVGIALKYANENNIEVAVRGGGHSTAGASSTDGGLMLYLESMRQVTVEEWPQEPGQKVFRIGGGANWGDVDDEGVKHGVHTVEGTVADTGVGGLTLGGGYGWLSGQYGLSIDCLVEAEVVLANGEVVRASDKENQDLFWALRGAGQNFGVVTEFVMKAFPQGDVWCGLFLFPGDPGTLEKVVKVINTIYTPDAETGRTKYGGKSMGGLGFISPPPAEGRICTFVAVVWNGTEEEGKEAWKDLYAIGPMMDTMAMHSFAMSNKLLAPQIGLRCSMKGCSYQMPLKADFVADVLKMYTEFFEKDPEDRGGSVLMWELYDPRQTVEQTNGCFANRGTHFNGLILPIWKSAESDGECCQWARDLNERFKQELEKNDVETGGPGHVGGVAIRNKKTNSVMMYGNYDQYDEKSRDLFGDNYPRLQRLKAEYDPKNLFNKLFPIYPETDSARI